MSSLKANNDASKLSLAAEELIKAASSHVESASLEIGNITIQELKNVAMSSSNMEQRLQDLKESIDSKINTMNQQLLACSQNLSSMESNFTASMTLMNQSVAQLTKNQTICWAIEHAEVNQFEFLNSGGIAKSGQFVKETLLYFRTGVGRYIPTDYFIRYASDGEKAFRDALSKQIHELLGQKPRIALKEGTEQYCNYYS
jgi:cell division GTPase FtsZ